MIGIATLAVNMLAVLYSILALNQQTATLLFVGDAMMHKAQIESALRADGSYDFESCFEPLSQTIAGADYAVANLEAPLGGKPYTGYPCFSAPESYADALQNVGFDMLLTANNHTLDRHDKGLRLTLKHLDRLGIDHLGTYHNSAARDTILPIVRNINGIKVGFLNYTYGTNGIEATNGAHVDYIDKELMRKDIANARSNGAELICVAIHWGNEYKLLPCYQQKELAEFLCKQDVDMIIGGHPHVIQPMEMRTLPSGKKCFLVYSLGNFISNMKTVDTRGGALAKVHISRGNDGVARVDSASYSLLFTVPPTGTNKNFVVMDADSVKGRWAPNRDQFVKSAQRIFDAHNKDVPRR